MAVIAPSGVLTAEAIATNIQRTAAQWTGQRSERQRRRALDRADFDQLYEASLPVEYGGLWEEMTRSIRSLAGLYRTLAGGDSSVALVASMHPAVITGGWPLDVDIPDEYRDAWETQKRWVFRPRWMANGGGPSHPNREAAATPARRKRACAGTRRRANGASAD